MTKRQQLIRPLCGSLVIALVCLVTPAVGSAAPRFGEETFRLTAGWFNTEFDTEVRLSGPAGGTTVNLEDTLGLDGRQTTFRGGMSWRFAPRHQLNLGYYNFKRDSLGVAKTGFTLDTKHDGTIEFSAGAAVETEFDWELVPVTYSYSFYKTDDLELAAALGVHWFNTDIGYAGLAVVNDEPLAFVVESSSASGPLPVFGAKADYAITPDWVVGGHVGYFGLDYGDYSGRLTDLRLKTEYWFTDYFSLGLAYAWYDIDITKRNGDYKIGVDYTYDGFEAFFGLRF